MQTRRLAAGRLTLALHALAERDGPSLLLLHALRGSSRDWGDEVRRWPGPVFALDLCGHGESEWIAGGGYFPEIFAADADRALAEIGPSRLVGSGVGAWAALLLAGTRPDDVEGALLLPGTGLAGGGPEPDFEGMVRRAGAELATLAGPPDATLATDPLVRHCETDVRPVAYARAFGERARCIDLFAGEDPAPPWWEAVAALPNAREHAAGTGWLGIALGRLREAGGPLFPGRDAG